MKLRLSLLLLLYVFSSVLLPAEELSSSEKQAKYLRLKTIFEMQLQEIEKLESELESTETELRSLRESHRKDTEKLQNLETRYNSILEELERETSLLQDSQRKLKALEEESDTLENSLQKAEESLRSYSQRVLRDKILIAAGALGVGILGGVIISR